MKTLTFIIALLLITSCTERGEIQQPPTDFIKIHGKVYKLTKIVPANDENAIWIMYPSDSSDSQPEVINYDIRVGKSTQNQSVIELK